MSQPLIAPSEPADAPRSPLAVRDLMVVTGDSLAVGIGAGHVSDGCMAQLAAWLTALHPHLGMVNLAVPSEGSISMIAPGAQLDRAVSAIGRAHTRGERVGPITLSIGANDCIEAGILGEDNARDRFAENLDTVLARVGAALVAQDDVLGDVLCVQTFYNPFRVLDMEPGLPSADQLAPRRARRVDFNDVIRDVAGSYGVRIADVAAAFTGREVELTWLRTGDIHPNSSGQRVIRDTYIDACGWR